MSSETELVQQLYDGFNARNIDDVLAALAEDVEWANEWTEAMFTAVKLSEHIGRNSG